MNSLKNLNHLGHTPNHTANPIEIHLNELKGDGFQEHCITQFYRFHDMPEPDANCVNYGFAYAMDSPPFIIWLMEKWVGWIDLKLDRIEEGTIEFADLFGLRGFTFDEFKLVVSARVGEEQFKRHRVFDYLYLTDVEERDYFTVSNLDDERELSANYLTAISEAIKLEIPALMFFFTRKIPLYFPLKSLKRGAYLVAQSGSGKSELIKLLFYDLQRRSQQYRNRTLISIEPHGDLSIELLSFALNTPDYRNRLVYLDPYLRSTAKEIFGYDLLGADYTFVINPFEVNTKNDREINYMTQELSSAFFEVLKNDATTQMNALIEACVETLLRKKGSDISDLKRFMDDDENEDLVQLLENLPNEERRKMASKIRNDNKLSQTKSGIFYRLQSLIGDSEFRKVITGASTVNLEQEMNKGKVILFNLSKAKMGQKASPVFGKLILALIQGYAVKRQELEKDKRKETFCFVDEFQNYVTPTIHNILAEARKYALHVFLSHQVIGQNMDTEMKRIIVGNTALKIAGDNGMDSLKFMSENMGKLTPKDFENLPAYSFFIHNKENKKNGVQTLRVPDFLVSQTPPFYLPKDQLKELFLWLANKSGYYKKVESKAVDVTGTKINPSSGFYNPNFED